MSNPTINLEKTKNSLEEILKATIIYFICSFFGLWACWRWYSQRL